MSRLIKKMEHGREKVQAQIDKISYHVEAEIRGRWNPNHRHDEEKERKYDEYRAMLNKRHRFESFAGDRWQNTVKWHIDGHDYFWAMSEVLDSAKEMIFILDWWLTPELYLRRPPAHNPEWRLDRILKRKAEAGVKIYIVVYKEVTQTMSMSSHHTKEALEALHKNIAVMRHPDHIGAVDSVEFWSHHEKVVVVDNLTACVGGLDACFGRWDTHNHPLVDVHPTQWDRTLFPGQDYNNARVMDFKAVDHYTSNAVSIMDVPRMPWHDVHMTMTGPAVLDVAQHFIERWNEIKYRKYRHDDHFDILAFPHTIHDVPNDAIVHHPHREEWHRIGRRFKQRWFGDDAPPDPIGGHDPIGTCRVQVVRSVSDWSHGVLTEHSIQNAYIQLIKEANHFIYIENQFFISNTGDYGPVRNRIAQAIVERIILAARDKRNFKVMVVIPEVPGFSGGVAEDASLRHILGATYRTINRGGHSIYEELQKAGLDPLDYIRIYHLRGYDRIGAALSFIQDMEKKSGVTFRQAQVALSRQWAGSDVSKDVEMVTIAMPKRSTADDANLGTTNAKNNSLETLPAPGTVEEAEDVIKRFEKAAKIDHDELIADSVGQHALQDKTSLSDEHWFGTADEERDSYVSEEIYIHSKLMIVDDTRVIMGSANLNDRSQRGDGDSEIALVVEDTDEFPSMMDGQKHMAARFAATLRRKLFREHLGLIDPQYCPPEGKEYPTKFMKPAPYPHADETQLKEDAIVEDPMSPELQRLWNETAATNRGIFTEIFRTVPSNLVRNMATYKTYLPHIMPGHVAPDTTLEQIKVKLSGVRGHVVDCPLEFLIEEQSLVQWSGYNPMMAVYL